jgi:hypothetical protein
MPYLPAAILLDGKHPGEVVAYKLLCAPFLATGDTLSSITSFDVQSGLTLTPSGKPAPAIDDDTDLVFWVGGGTSGTTYAGEIKVATAAGETLVINWTIEVLDPSPGVPA